MRVALPIREEHLPIRAEHLLSFYALKADAVPLRPQHLPIKEDVLPLKAEHLHIHK